MNMSGLSFDALPPINIPFRYFLIAPVFLIIIALFIIYSGPDIWFSRWHPAMLMITHGFTLGFMMSVMMGALFQIFPVVGGIGFPKVNLVANISFVGHLLGTCCLMLSFIWPFKSIKFLALLFLAMSFITYLSAVTWTLSKKLSQGVVVNGLRLAVFALLVTVLLGIGLMFGLFQGDKFFTNLHVLWGGLGWGGLLIISVSFQIIPMFHVAPQFNKVISKYIPIIILSLLFFMFLFKEISSITIGGVLLVNCIYSISVLYVIHNRKRKIPDTTIKYWQLASVSMFVLFIFFVLSEYVFAEALKHKQVLLMAAIFIYFYVISIIQGMLLKIIPFLSYTHLQQKCLMNFEAMSLLPNMHGFLNKKHANVLFMFHIFTGLSLMLTIVYPWLYLMFGVLLLLEFSGLLFLMVTAVRLYQVSDNKINHLLQLSQVK